MVRRYYIAGSAVRQRLFSLNDLELSPSKSTHELGLLGFTLNLTAELKGF